MIQIPGENRNAYLKKISNDEVKLKQYTVDMVGEFDHINQVAQLEATSIEDAVVHVLYSTEFKDYDNHITVDYFPNGTEANICLWLPFGIGVVYNVGEINEEVDNVLRILYVGR